MSAPADQGNAAVTVGAELAWSTKALKYLPIKHLNSQDDATSKLSPPIASWHKHLFTPSGPSGDEVFAFGGPGPRNDLYSISLSNLTATLLETSGDIPSPRMGHAFVAYRNYLIVWGGFERGKMQDLDNRLYLLDCGTREWVVIPTSQNPEPAGRRYHTMVLCGDKLLLFGGCKATDWLNDTWEMDLEPLQSPDFHPFTWTPTWTEWEKLDATPIPRIGHTCAAHKGKAFLYGGWDGKNCLDDLWRADPVKRSWKKHATTPWKMENHHATVVRDVMYIRGWIGGRLEIIGYRFSDRNWYKLGTAPSKQRLSQMGSQQDPARMFFLDKGVFHILDPAFVEFPAVEIHLSEDDVCFERVELLNPSPINTSGGSCDLFVGTYHPTGLKLAMKRPRGIEGQSEAAERFSKEAKMWSALKHPNILPFLGALRINEQLHLVSPWIEFGDLSGFVKHRSQYLKELSSSASIANVEFKPVHTLYRAFNEVKTAREIAAGIEYLHSIGIVHGDLKGPNILISDTGSALICDFGLTKFSGTATSVDLKGNGSVRWQSPELFKDHPKTFKSDVYAFSMIIVEIVTGDYPYPEIYDSIALVMKVLIHNARPKCEPAERFGTKFERLWDLAVKCWGTKPEERPSMNEVLLHLNP